MPPSAALSKDPSVDTPACRIPVQDLASGNPQLRDPGDMSLILSSSNFRIWVFRTPVLAEPGAETQEASGGLGEKGQACRLKGQHSHGPAWG